MSQFPAAIQRETLFAPSPNPYFVVCSSTGKLSYYFRIYSSSYKYLTIKLQWYLQRCLAQREIDDGACRGARRRLPHLRAAAHPPRSRQTEGRFNPFPMTLSVYSRTLSHTYPLLICPSFAPFFPSSKASVNQSLLILFQAPLAACVFLSSVPDSVVEIFFATLTFPAKFRLRVALAVQIRNIALVSSQLEDLDVIGSVGNTCL
jgi:hypothetical protein